MVITDSQDSLIRTHNGSNNHGSTPDLVRSDADNLSDIIVSNDAEWKNLKLSRK